MMYKRTSDLEYCEFNITKKEQLVFCFNVDKSGLKRKAKIKFILLKNNQYQIKYIKM